MKSEETTGSGVGRRHFLDWFLGTSTLALFGAIAYPVVRFLSPPRRPESSAHRVQAGRTDDPDLRQKGYKIIRFGSEPVILIRVARGDLRAFTATCTHLGCIVEFQKKEHRIWCNCHNGVYDLHGKNVAGPPPRPLMPLEVHVIGAPGKPGTIVISREKT